MLLTRCCVVSQLYFKDELSKLLVCWLLFTESRFVRLLAVVCFLLLKNTTSLLATDGRTLQIGPYQGDLLACGIIDYGKGVCGSAVAARTTQIVDDVTKIEVQCCLCALQFTRLRRV